MKLQKSIRLEPEVYKEIEELAKEQQRTYNNMIEYIINLGLRVIRQRKQKKE